MFSYSTLPISTVFISLVFLPPLAVSPPTIISLLPGRTATKELYRAVGKQLINSQKFVTGLYE